MVEFTANAGDAGDMGSIPGLARPLEKEIATHSNIPGKKKKNPMDRGAWQVTGHGVAKESDTPEHSILDEKMQVKSSPL